MAEGVYCCRLVKTSRRGFCIATLEKLMKYWPGGLYLVLKIPPRVPGDRPLLDIGYKYNYSKILGFIATEWSGSTEPGNPYLSPFPEIFLIFLLFPLFVLTC